MAAPRRRRHDYDGNASLPNVRRPRRTPTMLNLPRAVDRRRRRQRPGHLLLRGRRRRASHRKLQRLHEGSPDSFRVARRTCEGGPKRAATMVVDAVATASALLGQCGTLLGDDARERARGVVLPRDPVFTTRAGRRAAVEREAARRVTRIRVRSALRLRATSCCETMCRGLPGRARLWENGQDPIERLDYRRNAAPIRASESAGQRRPGRAGRRRGVRRRTLSGRGADASLRRDPAAGLEIIITEWLRRSRAVLPRL